ncbi:MAG: hypothetical protein Q6370_019660 [Candidatus Sigynarchaeota archaeon]
MVKLELTVPSGKNGTWSWEASMGTEQQPGGELDRDKSIVAFRRKPAKTGVNYIIWIPREIVRKGLIDPDAEYEVFLRKAEKKKD